MAKNDFDAALAESRDIISAAATCQSTNGVNGTPLMSSAQFHKIVELAFLGSFTAWEVFQEQSFVNYMLGLYVRSGKRPRRHALPVDVEHAHGMLRGDSSRPYVDWTVAGVTLARATRFFDGGVPFYPAIQPHTARLDEAKRIRNAIAHTSSEAMDSFVNMAREKLTHLGSGGIAPGAFLAAVNPRDNRNRAFVSHYLGVFERCAGLIVP